MRDYRHILSCFESIAGPIEPHANVLKKYRNELEEFTDYIVKNFYDTLFSYEETARIFNEGERPEREKTLSVWYLKVISGEYDDEFWKWQYYRVGLSHVIRGVTNEIMLSAMTLIQKLFEDKLKEKFSLETAKEIYDAFKHITSAISVLIAAGYMNSYLKAVSESTGMNLKLIERNALISAKQLYKEYS